MIYHIDRVTPTITPADKFHTLCGVKLHSSFNKYLPTEDNNLSMNFTDLEYERLTKNKSICDVCLGIYYLKQMK